MEEQKQESNIEDTPKEVKPKNVVIGVVGCALLPLLIGGDLLVSWIRDPDRPKASFVYDATEDGKIEATGRVKYSEVSKWYLVEKELKNGSSKLFISDESITNDFFDVQNDKIIGKSYSDNPILQKELLQPYLVTYDMVYDSYTIEDINQLFEFIEADWEYTIPKESDKIIMKINESNIGW